MITLQDLFTAKLEFSSLLQPNKQRHAMLHFPESISPYDCPTVQRFRFFLFSVSSFCHVPLLRPLLYIICDNVCHPLSSQEIRDFTLKKWPASDYPAPQIGSKLWMFLYSSRKIWLFSCGCKYQIIKSRIAFGGWLRCFKWPHDSVIKFSISVSVKWDYCHQFS